MLSFGSVFDLFVGFTSVFLQEFFPLLTQLSYPLPQICGGHFFWRELLGAKTLRAKVKLGTSLRKKGPNLEISRQQKSRKLTFKLVVKIDCFTLLK